jgi:hypothetical protein
MLLREDLKGVERVFSAKRERLLILEPQPRGARLLTKDRGSKHRRRLAHLREQL